MRGAEILPVQREDESHEQPGVYRGLGPLGLTRDDLRMT
jgi:hypothetical protein